MTSNNLPEYTIPLVGRASEITTICMRLNQPDCRMLTLVGPGGIGKTRLAVEGAQQQVSNFSDGVYFVALQPVASVDNIVPTIANAIVFEFTEGTDLTAQLNEYLRDQQLLLVLDNCEHLLAGAGLFAELLNNAPYLKLLVTSREALNLRDEWLYHVDGLPFPEGEADVKAGTFAAIELFVEHATRMRHDFSLNAERDHVLRICQLVQGMPLGIELAATGLRRLPCVEIARELQRGLDILQTNLHDMPDRHQSMRAVFDHSWKLLSAAERNVLMGLSVFRGGFRREAAEQVVGASLDVLLRLVEKSMLRVSSAGRYDMHELLRQYAEECLGEMPEYEKIARDQHSSYYCEFMDHPIGDFLGKDNRHTLKEIDAEIDNVRAAWHRAIEQHQAEYLHKAALGLFWYTYLRKWHEEGEEAIRQALAMLRTVEPNRANRIALGYLLIWRATLDLALRVDGRMLARRFAEESVSILRPLDVPRELGLALHILGWSASVPGNFNRANRLLEEAVELYNETSQYEFQAMAVGRLAENAEHVGDYQASEIWHERSLKLARQTGSHETIAMELGGLGNFARLRGQYGRSQRLLEECLFVAQAAGLLRSKVFALHKLGELAQSTGQLDLARSYFEESLHLSAESPDRLVQTAWSLTHLAEVVLLQGDLGAARRLYEEAQTVVPAGRVMFGYARLLTGLGNLAWHEGNYEEARHYHRQSLALQPNDKSGIDFVRNLIMLGRIALRQDNISEAQRYFLEALQIAVPAGFYPAVLEIFIGVAYLFVQQGNLDAAVRLATLVNDHPISPATAKAEAEKLLATPELQARETHSLPTEELATVAAQLLEQLTMQVEQPLVEPLTPREQETLALLVEGLTNAQIAERLFVTTGTVKSHTSNIYSKLGVANRVQAIAQARQIGLV